MIEERDERAELEAVDNEEPLNLSPEFFDAPTPGESLTSDPENPKAYEKPAQFNTAEEATHKVFMILTEDDNHFTIVDAIGDGVPLDVLTQVFLFKGFQEGLWSTDLMLLLTEPTLYMLMWIADQAGIEAQIDSDGDDWDDEFESRARTAIEKDNIGMKGTDKSEEMARAKEQLPASLLSKMDAFEETNQVQGEE